LPDSRDFGVEATGFFSDLKSVLVPVDPGAEAVCPPEQPLVMQMTEAANKIPNNELRMGRKSSKENHLME
jgi:hypothetical protein